MIKTNTVIKQLCFYNLSICQNSIIFSESIKLCMSSYINGRYVSTPFIRKAIMYWKHPCFFPNHQIRKKQDLIYPKNSVMALRFDAFKNFSNFSKEGFSLKLLLSPIICKNVLVEFFFESKNLKNTWISTISSQS